MTTEAIENFAELFAHSIRTPILHTPKEYGMDYEDIFFPSLDGVILEGWFIPANSDRLIICNHFLPGNRAGYPGHLEPWTQFGGFEVNFLHQYKALHDAGYNILCYDMRNHGRSNQGSGGLVGIGLIEYRDVIGSLRYAKSRKETSNMKVSLLSICLGGNSTIVAYNKHPTEFEHVISLILLQPVSTRPLLERMGQTTGIGAEKAIQLFDASLFKKTGFHIDELSPVAYANSVNTPSLVIQVHNDSMTFPYDVETIFEKIGAKEKKLHWIEGTTRRFDGYNYLGQHPEVMLEWFNAHHGVKT